MTFSCIDFIHFFMTAVETNFGGEKKAIFGVIFECCEHDMQTNV